MVAGWVFCATLVAACGRVGFDEMLADASGADATFEPRICARYPQALYCSDFEDGLVDLDLVNGSVISDGGYGGSAGLRFDVDPGEMPRATHTLQTPIESGTVYIAGRLLLAPGAFIGQYLVVVQTTSNVSTKVSFDLVDRDVPQVVNSEIVASGERGMPGEFPRGRWFCYEMMIDVSAASERGVTLSIDGVERVRGYTGQSTLPAGGWVRMELGAIASTANTAPATVSFDNWVIQTAPIGCP